jgi:hypothetical protein
VETISEKGNSRKSARVKTRAEITIRQDHIGGWEEGRRLFVMFLGIGYSIGKSRGNVK